MSNVAAAVRKAVSSSSARPSTTADTGRDGTANSGRTSRPAHGKGRQVSPSRDGSVGQHNRQKTTWMDAPPADPVWCANGKRAIVVDRAWQRAWLCDAGAILTVIPVTSARSQPDPGAYAVYAKDWDTFSDYGPRRSTLDRFIAFAIGEDEGARVGFHAIPRYENDGALAQPIESVGTLGRFGDSSGCIRLLPEHADLVWNFLQVYDSVVVIS